MYIQSSISELEKTLHSKAESYQDLLDYQTEALAYCSTEEVSIPLRITWNREFMKLMENLMSPEDYIAEWIPKENEEDDPEDPEGPPLGYISATWNSNGTNYSPGDLFFVDGVLFAIVNTVDEFGVVQEIDTTLSGSTEVLPADSPLQVTSNTMSGFGASFSITIDFN